MYKNKTQNSEDGSRKPRNCNQVTLKLKRAITRDYGSWMENSLEDGDGKSYAGKSPMYKDALARKYNVSKSAVNYVLRQAKKEEVLKMADLYAEGKDIGEIAAKFGKSRKAVKSAIARYNKDSSKKSWFNRAIGHVKTYAIAYATAASLLIGAGTIYGCMRKSADNANKPAESKTLEEKTAYHAEDLTSDDLVKRTNAIVKYNPNEVHDRLIREQEAAARLAQANAAKGIPEQKPVEPQPIPEPQPVPMPEPQIAEKPAEKPEVKPEPIPEPKPVEPQPIPQPQPEPEPEQIPELEAEAEPQPEPEPQPAQAEEKKQSDKVRAFYEIAEKIGDRAGSVEKNVYSNMIASVKSDIQRDGWAEAGIMSLTRTLEERLAHDKLNAEETQ
jgi:outer membrane biosynthesis protein TonB